MIPAQTLSDARTAQAQAGVSDLAAALALAVAGPESGFNPGAKGDYMLGGRIVGRDTPGAVPTSFGYTQLHNADGGDGGGMGTGYPVSELTDGVANFAIAMRGIQDRLDAGADAYGAIQPWSTRDTAIGLLEGASAALGSAISVEIPAVGNRESMSLATGLLLAFGALVILDLVGG